MPCSCKNKRPAPAAPQPVSTHVAQPAAPQQPQQPVYDFSSNVKPNQLCLNCAQKHTSLALSLAQTDSQFDYCIAASQLYLASLHFQQHDKDVARYCRCLAHHMLMQPHTNWLPYIELLLKYTMQEATLTPGWDSVQDYGIDTRSQSASLRSSLLNLCRAYSLLFTEITYEKVNKPTAVGILVHAVIPGYFGRKLKDLRPQVRQIWKILQDAQPDTTQWDGIRLRLEQVIRNVYNIYITVLEPPIGADFSDSASLSQSQSTPNGSTDSTLA